MKYYVVTDAGVQWFTYLVALGDGGGVVECIEASNLPEGTLMKNIHAREPIEKWLHIRHGSMVLGGGDYGGWNVSKLEFDRMKRLLELQPAVREYEKLTNSV